MNTSLSKNYKFFITVFIAGLCTLTTLISVGFGALNQDIKIAGTVEYRKDYGNMMKAFTSPPSTFYHQSTYKKYITSVDFLDNKNIPNNAVVSWDMSYITGDQKVFGWLIDDPNNTGYYKLYIGADGDVVANYDSKFVFSGLTKVETINFNNNFDTSKATDMSYMFRYCNSVSQIIISSLWDISNVTTASEPFYGCTSLPNYYNTGISMAKPTTQGGYLTLV